MPVCLKPLILLFKVAAFLNSIMNNFTIAFKPIFSPGLLAIEAEQALDALNGLHFFIAALVETPYRTCLLASLIAFSHQCCQLVSLLYGFTIFEMNKKNF